MACMFMTNLISRHSPHSLFLVRLLFYIEVSTTRKNNNWYQLSLNTLISSKMMIILNSPRYISFYYHLYFHRQKQFEKLFPVHELDNSRPPWSTKTGLLAVTFFLLVINASKGSSKIEWLSPGWTKIVSW